MPTDRSRRAKRPAAVQSPFDSEPAADERWWAIVVAVAPELGSGRYGVWDHKPVVKLSDDGNMLMINAHQGQSHEEATVYINLRDTLTVTIGKIAHFDAQPVQAENAANVSQS